MDKFLGTPKMLAEAREKKPGKKWIIELLLFIPVFLVISSIESIPVTIAAIAWIIKGFDYSSLPAAGSISFEGISERIAAIMNSFPWWLTLISLFSTGLAIVGVILFCKWFQKRKPASLGLRRGSVVKDYLIGTAIGIVMFSVCALVGILTGAYRISLAESSPILVIVFMLGYIIQGASEEVLCRGYLMASISRKNPVWLAVLLSSVIFAMLHFANPGFFGSPLPFINITLFGILMCVYTLRRGNLWGACAIHTFWNFFQGNIFGISVSGTGVQEGASVATMEICGTSPSVLTGGAFGAEGSIICTAVEVIAIVLILLLVKKNKAEHELV